MTVPASLLVKATEPAALLHVVLTMVPTVNVGTALTDKSI